jgi:REP element-mobilizing transposase RayT
MNRKPNRKKYYNYSSAGYYFVTICTKDRLSFFGKIAEDKMIMNEFGRIAEKCWIEIPIHFPNAKTDEFVVMPNHFHGIIIINDPVGNRHAFSLQEGNENRQHQKLPVIIGSFKSAVTKLTHRNYAKDFQWQKSYYDHIIRDESSLNNIRQYIRQNPTNWDMDKNNLLFCDL